MGVSAGISLPTRGKVSSLLLYQGQKQKPKYTKI
jgi:hypothetical protein